MSSSAFKGLTLKVLNCRISFYPLEVVDCGTETQFQMGKNDLNINNLKQS